MVNAEEFQQLKEQVQVLETLEFTHLRLSVQYKPPARPRNGMLVFADGTSWNPGNKGRGLYYFDNGTWYRLTVT